MEGSRSLLKSCVGSVLEVVCPGVVRDLEAGANPSRNTRLKRYIIHARTVRAKRRGNERDLEQALFRYWHTDTADGFYDRFTDRFDRWFLGPHHEIVDRMVALSKTTRFDQLIEVGCGDGRVLAHCAAAMPQIPKCVGIDINPAIIARNGKTFADDPRLSFTSADASGWLADNVTDGTMLMTYGGVMEYFSPEALSSIFATLARHDRVAVALVEPVDPAHDLGNDPASHVFGQENSFSHNHAALLSGAGLRVVFSRALHLGGVSWIMILADKPN